MRYSRALLAAALALSAAACGQSVSAPEPAFDGVGFGSGGYTAPAGPSYGVSYGGGQRTDTTTVVSASTTAIDTSTIAGPGSGESRGVSYGGGQ